MLYNVIKNCIFTFQAFEKRVGTIYTTFTALFKEVESEGKKFGDDVQYLAEFTSGCKKFDPWIQQSEAKKSVGMVKPTNLQEAQDQLDSATVGRISLCFAI